MSAKSKSETCPNCRDIPEYIRDEGEIERYRQKLIKIEGSGTYYRGEEMQLSVFNLLQCPECKTYYEDGHHYYSDPESTMGLARDEDDWYVLTRLSEEMSKERLERLRK